MSYEKFAYVYDELMKDVPYDQWVGFLESALVKYQVNGKKFLDLACGTGELSVKFALNGYEVTGADLSSDMLAVASAKSEEWKVNIPFYLQDMTELEKLGDFDIVGIFCDSLNYLKTEQDVFKTFQGVFQQLKPGGLFVFDVHSIFKIDEIFAEGTFTHTDEAISYIWNSFPGEVPHSVEHELTFFVYDECTEKYDRMDEWHFQRTFTPEFYKRLLEEAGFQQVGISGDFTGYEPLNEAERIFFTAIKP